MAEVVTNIEDLRNRIDVIDDQLVRLLNVRVACAVEVGRLKHETGLPIYQPEREAQVLNAVRKSATELAAIVAENPVNVEAAEHSRYLVAFVQDAAALSGLAAVHPLVVSPEQFAVGKNAAYLFCARGILESKAGAALVGKAGVTATTRNWATVLKLHALANAGDA